MQGTCFTTSDHVSLITGDLANYVPCLVSLDHHSDWPVKDSPTAAIGACGQETGSLL